MKNIIISLAYFLITIITASAVIRIGDDLVHSCTTKCPFTLANAIFDPNGPKIEKISEGPIKGLVVFAQDEVGSTTVTGYFSRGFKSTKNYKFLVVDNCGDVVHDLTKRLKVTIYEGGTKAFTYKFDDLNLDCDKEGILMTEAERNCKNLSVRGRSDKFLKIIENGSTNSQAKIILNLK
ncbi:15300_t:CDS:1 [Funneliformis geosporum]|uniref:4999_t:CDS:1 n=1 Tax=Funneliformis geosporum TaxID=1117311 RepID=A0A9W4S9M4_9GLOM|nr:4999_t:CDS:1 [Funneliformis geosporum]CAI2182051.1 15300_t:CDS:1 [Funneliformis geosporum]